MRSQPALLAAAIGTLAVTLWGLGLPAAAEEQPTDSGPQEYARTHTWTDETLDIFEKIPVQDGGRVKPLSTVANFALLRLSGRLRQAHGD